MTNAWKPEDVDKAKFGDREYHHIDPTAINMADFARDLYGEQVHHGEVREYNAAKNSKHPENTLSLDWASRPGTVFTTEAEDWKGKYVVVDMPKTKGGKIYISCAEEYQEGVEAKPRVSTQIPADELGIVADETNHFKQVKTCLVARGLIGKAERERLTKRSS